MKIDCSYKLGKTYYAIHENHIYGRKPCVQCKGKGQIKVLSEDTRYSFMVKCPECNGDGLICTNPDPKFIVEKFVLDRVRIEIGKGYTSYINVLLKRPSCY